MDITARYLDLPLRSPLVASASPLTQGVDSIRALEDAGIAAVVLPSVLEEQLRGEAPASLRRMAPGPYLELVRRAKASVRVPVIASVNGALSGEWLGYCKRLEEAGADAIELNLYYLPRDFSTSAEEVERGYLEIVRGARSATALALAVKLGPFFTSLGHFVSRLEAAGADGVVLFNRFYQPDVDLEGRRVFPHLLLSTENDLRLPLRWIGLLHSRVALDLAATGGIYTGHDVLKLVAVGARATLLCATLVQNGIPHVKSIERELCQWMDACRIDSLDAYRGSLSQARSDQPGAFERAQYVETIDEPIGPIDPIDPIDPSGGIDP